MMQYEYFNVRGLSFSLAGDGFRHAREDFDRIANRIADKLYDIDPEFLRGLHAGALFEDGAVADPGAVEFLDCLAHDEAKRVLSSWANTENVYVTLYPV